MTVSHAVPTRRLALIALAAVFGGSAASAAEVIQLRSGQVGSLPGLPGQFDDVMTFGPVVTSGPLSASPFTAADFNATISSPAVVIQPHGAWLPSLTFDPQARWVGTGLLDPVFPLGAPGTTLYRVPFNVTTTGITNAVLSIAWAADDTLGDQPFGGANPIGAYLRDPSGNVTPLAPATGGGYSFETFALGMNVTGAIGTGANELFLYQRDQGFAVSGVIFSATFDIVPAPGAAALLGLAGFVSTRRRRA